MMEDYGGLNTATLGTEYLMTNATTHSFIFGAMAELVDNARDAGSNKLEIYTAEGDDETCSPLLCFKDDGCGMSKDEAENVIVFGSSHKTDQEEPIGMYGNGLKSGSMRLGRDMILFTKKDGILTCLMISRTFYQAENITQIVVPVPSFNASNKTMCGTDKRKHTTEINLITKYSPFRDEKSLLEQFDGIKGPSGTIVMVYNLSTTPNGELELDFLSDPDDIKTSLQLDNDNEQELSDVLERRSFRAYASILYKSPRMKIILQKKRVRTRLLAYSLYLPKRIQVTYKSFKNQSEKQINQAKLQIDVAKRNLVEVQSQISILNKSTGITNKSQMMQVRKLQNKEHELSRQLAEKKGIMELRKKQAKKSEQLEFYFGINANERYHDGIFFYNADRLIKMYVKEGTLQSKEEITYRGIIAVVSVPKSSLLPTHNKQDFNDHAEYKKLKKCVDQAMMQYWEDVVMGEWKQGLTKGWDELGYAHDWRKPPSEEEKFKIRRARLVKHLQQCDKCLKWRVIPYHKNFLYKDFPDSWQCSDSLDPSSNNCTKTELLPKIDSSKLKHKSLLKPPEPPTPAPSLKEPPSRKMSAVQQEQNKIEERKRKAAAAEHLNKVAQQRSRAAVRDVAPSKSKASPRSPPARPSPASRKPQSSAPSRVGSSSNARASASSSARASSSSTASTTSKKREATPEPPPLKQTRRSSPARTVKKEEPVTTAPSASTKRARLPPTSNKVSRSNSVDDTTTEELMDSTPEDPQTPNSVPKIPSTPADTPKTSQTPNATPTPSDSTLSTSAVKVETSTPNPSKLSLNEKLKKYRMVTINDLVDEEIGTGATVQGRYQNKWQDAEVLEVRPDNVLVRYRNKISLAMKVKNPEKNVDGELRVETEYDDEVGEMSQPSSTTMDEIESGPSSRYTAVHHKKLIALVKSLDRSLDVDSLSPSNLADLDVLTLLNRYSTKLRKESAGASQTESAKEIQGLKSQVAQLKSELEASRKETREMKEKYEQREEDRFERIRTLFSRVLTVCIGAGPESRFTTYEQLVELLENIAASLAD